MKIDSKQALVAFFVLYVLLFLTFYPKYYLDNDESQYLRAASLFLHGKLWLESDELGYLFVSNGARYFSMYPPGQSLLLLPAIIFGIHASFMVGLLLHAFGFFLFYRIVKQLGLNPLSSIIYLFFPVFVYFNQRIYSDYPLAVLLFAGFYYLKFSKHYWLSPLFFGLSFLVRPAGLAFFLPLLVLEFFSNKKRAILSGAMLAPFFILYLAFNYYVTGSLFFGGYSYFQQEGGLFISLSDLPEFLLLNIVLTTIYLTVLYPAMLPGFIANAIKRDKSTLLSVLAYLVFTLFWLVSTWVLLPRFSIFSCYRYLLPVIPLMLIDYAAWLENAAKRFIKLDILYIISGILLLFCSGAIMAINNGNSGGTSIWSTTCTQQPMRAP